MKTIAKLEPGRLYHVYNRGNNRGNIFLEERNYFYFLNLYQRYVCKVADTYAYCLLRNHFHFLVRTKEVETTNQAMVPSQQLSNFFNSYAKSINKGYGRSGGLFEGPFNRIEVPSESYFIQLILYIHLNPQRHGLVKNFESYPYSSYQSIISDGGTFLRREEVLDFFGTKNEFIEAHRAYRQAIGLKKYLGGDDFF